MSANLLSEVQRGRVWCRRHRLCCISQDRPWLHLLSMIVTKEFDSTLKMLCQHSGCGEGQPRRQEMHCLHQQEERDPKSIACTGPPDRGDKQTQWLQIQHLLAASEYRYSTTQMTFFPFNSLFEAKLWWRLLALRIYGLMSNTSAQGLIIAWA